MAGDLKELYYILQCIKDNNPDPTIKERALNLPDVYWEVSEAVRIIGGANPAYIENVLEYARPYAENEYPEFFFGENNNDNDGDVSVL